MRDNAKAKAVEPQQDNVCLVPGRQVAAQEAPRGKEEQGRLGGKPSMACWRQQGHKDQPTHEQGRLRLGPQMQGRF